MAGNCVRSPPRWSRASAQIAGDGGPNHFAASYHSSTSPHRPPAYRPATSLEQPLPPRAPHRRRITALPLRPWHLADWPKPNPRGVHPKTHPATHPPPLSQQPYCPEPRQSCAPDGWPRDAPPKAARRSIHHRPRKPPAALGFYRSAAGPRRGSKSHWHKLRQSESLLRKDHAHDPKHCQKKHPPAPRDLYGRAAAHPAPARSTEPRQDQRHSAPKQQGLEPWVGAFR